MTSYLVRRIFQIIPTLLVISTIIYALVALTPGDPLDELRRGNPGFSQADYDRLARAYGLDKPWYVRYWLWLQRVIVGNEACQAFNPNYTRWDCGFGISRGNGIPALRHVFYNRLPNTLLLSGLSLLVAFFIAVPAGIYSALRQYTLADYAVTVFNFIGVSIPIFWLGIMLVRIFTVWLGILPGSGLATPGKVLYADAVPFAEIGGAVQRQQTDQGVLITISDDTSTRSYLLPPGVRPIVRSNQVIARGTPLGSGPRSEISGTVGILHRSGTTIVQVSNDLQTKEYPLYPGSFPVVKAGQRVTGQQTQLAKRFVLATALDYLWDRLKHLILPILALSSLQMASWTRFMRSSMLEVVRLDYVRTARAKGLAEKVVIYKHALKNAILPIITLVGLAIPSVFSGAVLTETVFDWPGMGTAIYQAIIGSDWNVAMVALVFLSLLFQLCNLAADVAYALIDPRIRYD